MRLPAVHRLLNKPTLHSQQVLEEKLPPGNPPAEESEPAFSNWREELQRALVETFCDVSEDFACKGQLAGTTITVVLQVRLDAFQAAPLTGL